MSKVKLIFCAFLAQLLILSFSINLVAEDANSLNNKIINAKTTNEKLCYLSKITDYYINKSDPLAQKYASKFLKIAERTNDDTFKIIAYHKCGLAYQSISNYALAINNYLQAESLSLGTNNKKYLVLIYKDIGESYRSFFEYSASLKYLNKSLQLSHKLKDKFGEAKALNRIGAVYAEFNNIKDRNKSLYYTNKSNSIAESLDDYDLLTSNYLLLGANYSYLKDYQRAFDYFNKSLVLVDSCSSSEDKSLILKAIAVMYYYLNDNAKAIEYGQKAYKNALENNNLTYIWLSTNILCQVYEKIHNSDSALKYLKITADARSDLYMKEKDLAVFKSEAKFQKEQFAHEKKEEIQRERDKTLFFIIIIIIIFISLTFSMIRFGKLKKTYKELNIQKDIIEVQKHELALVNHTKDTFFSIIAHDLRSPFNSILGLSYELKYSADNMELDDVKMFAGEINTSSHITYNLLENLLEWAKLQTGAIIPKPEEIEFKDLLELTTNLVQVSALKKNITIKLVTIENCVIYADINMITSIMRNLISNAIKFSHKGNDIMISTKIKDKFLEIFISDNGEGMDDKTINSLFKIGQTLSNLGTENEKGSGLGLILCKELIEIQGGTISVRSEYGIGSTFSITIPIAAQNP
ncbi:MAG: ATP-binding protein [bacterium]